MVPRLLDMANFWAFCMFGIPCTPSVSEVGMTTRLMFAPGAMACAQSTSSVVSYAQPILLVTFLLWKFTGLGRPV